MTNNYILATNSFETNLLTRAKGSWVWDTNNKKYLDMVSGCWSVNLGHNHPEVARTIQKQVEKQIHRSMWFLTPEAIDAAEKLVKFLPFNHDRVTFLSSGSEAMEFALNFALKVTKKEKILSLKDGFYGSFGLGRESSYYSPKGSKLKIDYPKCSDENCNCLDTYNELIDLILNEYAKDLACFAIEPIMVSGGIHKPCTKFIDELCRRLQEENVLVIANEVTAGFGRTGKKFAHEHFNFRPDIVALGKAMGNGFPVSAIVTDSELESKLSKAELYYAQSHQLDPLGTAVAGTVIDIFEQEKIIEKSQNKINELTQFIKSLAFPFIKESRAHGMVFAIDIQEYNNKSALEIIQDIKNNLLQEGIIVGYSSKKELIRLLPILTMDAAEINFFEEKMLKVLTDIK
ncbi:MAG: aspartate aminotransferase family protein [Asgard group archaeon]|nr:aspartate aminotransferase family protein [Asgard group archaeon]